MNVREDFEYIIVRAGSAGYILAAGGPGDATEMASSPSHALTCKERVR